MEQALITFLIIFQFFNFSQADKTTHTYIDPINNEFFELEYNSKNEVKNLLDFVKEHAIHPINPEILKNYVLEGIVMSLDDKYAYIDNKSKENFLNSINGGYSGFGFDLDVIGSNPDGKYVISNVLEDSVAYEKGLKVGDIIKSINNIPIYANQKLYEGALDMKRDDEMHDFVIIRNKKKLHFTLKPKEYHEPPIFAKTINKDIYYIRINNCSEKMPLYMEQELKKIRDFKFDKVIIDLRNNLGGWEDSVIKVCAMMCKDEVIAYQKDREGISEIKRGDTKQIIDLSPVVLISKNTASSAELLAACLKKHCSATLIGQKTYGKNEAQGIYEFGGRILKFTSAYLSANESFELKFLGVYPDIALENQYVPEYKDIVLEKALDLLK